MLKEVVRESRGPILDRIERAWAPHVVLDERWREFIVGPDAESAPYPSAPSVACGVYLLLDEVGAVIYAGRSANIANRLKQHAKSKLWNRCAAVSVPADCMGAVELAHIHALRPRMNEQVMFPHYLAHDQMVPAIREAWARIVFSNDSAKG